MIGRLAGSGRTRLTIAWLGMCLTSGCLVDFDTYRFDRPRDAGTRSTDGGPDGRSSFDSNESPGCTSPETCETDGQADASWVDPDPCDGTDASCDVEGGVSPDSQRTADAATEGSDAADVEGSLTVEPVYAGEPVLNHYVAADGTTPWDAAGKPCEPSESSSVDDCIHAGVLRKVRVETPLSCTELAARDDLDAFEWTCDEADEEHAVFRTLGLRTETHLQDLVDLRAKDLRKNAVSIIQTIDGEEIARSSPARWWSDDVIFLHATNESAIRLDRADTLYVVFEEVSDEEPYAGIVLPTIQIAADRIGLVVDSLTWLRYKANGADALATETGRGAAFAWVEGRIDISGRSEVPIDIDGNHVLLRHLDLFESDPSTRTEIALRLQGRANRLELSKAVTSRGIGVSLDGTGHQVDGVSVETEESDAILSQASESRLTNVEAHGGGITLGGAHQLVSEARVDGAHAGLSISGSGGHVATSVQVANCPIGIVVQSDNNSLVTARVNNAIQDGVYIGAGSSRAPANNRLVDILVSNTAGGLGLLTANNTLILQSTCHATGSGFLVMGGESNQLAHLLAFANIWNLRLTSASIRNTVRDVTLLDGFEESTDADKVGDLFAEGNHNKFEGELWITADATCKVRPDADEPGLSLVDGRCVPDGTSTAIISRGVSLLPHVVGKVRDTVNQTAKNAGSIEVSQPSIRDWFHFENPRRIWGLGSIEAFPHATTLFPCTESDQRCTVYDWTRRPEAPPIDIATKYDDPKWVQTHRWYAPDATACREIPGAEWRQGDKTCVSTFLQSAFEAMGDPSGNQNGLCESGETCIHQPEFGALVDHTTNSATQPMNVGELTDITVYSYRAP